MAENEKFTLYLVRAAPGGGKTTFANKVFPGVMHVENDMYFMKENTYVYDCKAMPKAISFCMDTVKFALSHRCDCVVCNTFTKRKYVEAYRKLAEEYGAGFVVYRMRGDFKNVHSVPEDVLKSMKDSFEDWDGEINVYPNLNQDPDDPAFRPYMYTTAKVGGKITVKYDGRNGRSPEQHSAMVTDIRQGTYDYLNVFYVEDDTGKAGMTTLG